MAKSDRKSHTLIRIEDIVDNPLGVYAVGVISQWNPHRSVWLPLPKAVLEIIEQDPGPESDVTIYVRCMANTSADAMWELELEGPWTVERVVFAKVDMDNDNWDNDAVDVIHSVTIEAEAIQPDNTPKPKSAIPKHEPPPYIDSLHTHILE